MSWLYSLVFAGLLFSSNGEQAVNRAHEVAVAPVATEAVVAALKQPHLQDALQPYREKWGTTLGEYLRGPQQNLRFLLPLVYRNPTMTRLMAESILLGKPVVR